MDYVVCEDRSEQDKVKVLEDAIEGSAPEGGEELAKVKGGVYQWWQKVETDGT